MIVVHVPIDGKISCPNHTGSVGDGNPPVFNSADIRFIRIEKLLSKAGIACPDGAIPATEYLDEINALHKSDVVLNLTGSLYAICFNVFNPYTVWFSSKPNKIGDLDFFCSDDPETVAKLVVLGYTLEANSTKREYRKLYGDSTITSVYRKTIKCSTGDEISIDIQVCKSVEIKWMAQLCLYANANIARTLQDFDKDTRRTLWQLAVDSIVYSSGDKTWLKERYRQYRDAAFLHYAVVKMATYQSVFNSIIS